MKPVMHATISKWVLHRLSIVLAILCGGVMSAQAQPMKSDAHIEKLSDFSTWFSLLELPFLFVTVYFAFRTARALKGGVFGQGISLMAWGFLVMGVGHLHLQGIRLFQINVFATLFGAHGSVIVWVIALIITWALSGLGFYSLYKTSKTG